MLYIMFIMDVLLPSLADNFADFKFIYRKEQNDLLIEQWKLYVTLQVKCYQFFRCVVKRMWTLDQLHPVAFH